VSTANNLLLQKIKVVSIFNCKIEEKFTGDILTATDQLELLCRQSKIQSHGMTQYQEQDHFVRKTLSCSSVVFVV